MQLIFVHDMYHMIIHWKIQKNDFCSKVELQPSCAKPSICTSCQCS